METMTNKEIKGIAVISIAEGQKLGTVDRVYLDRDGKRIIGFSATQGGGLLAPDAATIMDVSDVRSIGPDAVTLDRREVAQGAEVQQNYGGLIDIDEVLKERVVTEGGAYVGQVSQIEFDTRTFQLTSIEVSPGFFKSNKTIPIQQVTTIGPDLVIVADAVCATDAATAGEHRWVVGDVATTSTTPSS